MKPATPPPNLTGRASADVSAAAASSGGLPRLGCIGWGPESALLLQALRPRFPQVVAQARSLVGSGSAAKARVGSADAAGGAPPASALDTIPTVEALFEGADWIIAEGGMGALEPYLSVMRLAITDRHVLVLLGQGWAMDALLTQFKERKIVRCAIMPSGPEGSVTLAFHAAPYFSVAEMEAFRAVFSHLELAVELADEAHFEVLHGLTEFAPAAYYTFMEAMADAVAMTGFPRQAAVRILATLLQGGAATLLAAGGTSPALLRERALELDLAAAGLIELESAGVRGTLMRSMRAAMEHSTSRARAIVAKQSAKRPAR